MNKGVLLVVSGPSGCGKGTVLQYVLEDDSYCYSVSATTRLPREGEVDGVHYFFMTKAEFEESLAQGNILEHTVYCENMYGTPKRFVAEKLSHGVNVVLEIETEGAFNVKRLMPEALLVFISPPDMDVLEDRLRGRGTEDDETIKMRLEKARKEMLLAPLYDVVIVNEEGSAEKTAEQIIKAVDKKRKELKG